MDPRDLERLVRDLTRQAVNETLGPLQEDERRRQQAQAEAEAARSAPLAEADDDEAEAEAGDKAGDKAEDKAEKKPTVVSKKLATGKEEPKPKARIPSGTDVKEASYDQIVTLLNLMRSGRSTKDPAIRAQMQDYYKGLNSGERQAMFVLLSGLTQILAGGVEGDEAPDPSEVGIDIEPTRAERDREGRGPKVRSGRPAGEEGDTPIKVGEVADRSALRRRLWGRE